MTAPPPIGTQVSILRTEFDECPHTMIGIVVTGEVWEPADCVCHCVVRVDSRYFRVHEPAHVNPSEETIRDARVQWATTVIAWASQVGRSAYEPKCELAERVLRGET